MITVYNADPGYEQNATLICLNALSCHNEAD